MVVKCNIGQQRDHAPCALERVNCWDTGRMMLVDELSSMPRPDSQTFSLLAVPLCAGSNVKQSRAAPSPSTPHAALSRVTPALPPWQFRDRHVSPAWCFWGHLTLTSLNSPHIYIDNNQALRAPGPGTGTYSLVLVSARTACPSQY